MHFEEIQMEYDSRKYDMEAVTMNVCSDNRRLLVLEVIIYFFSLPDPQNHVRYCHNFASVIIIYCHCRS